MVQNLKEDLLSRVWKLLINNNSRLEVSKIQELLSNPNIKNRDIEKAVQDLHNLHLIDYISENGDLKVTKKEILGEIYDKLPCLGCDHLNECRIGGERFSPENCQYLELWLHEALKKD